MTRFSSSHSATWSNSSRTCYNTWIRFSVTRFECLCSICRSSATVRRRGIPEANLLGVKIFILHMALDMLWQQRRGIMLPNSSHGRIPALVQDSWSCFSKVAYSIRPIYSSFRVLGLEVLFLKYRVKYIIAIHRLHKNYKCLHCGFVQWTNFFRG